MRRRSPRDIPNKVEVGAIGIDGRIYPVGAKPTDDAAKGKKGQTIACSPRIGSRFRSSRWTRSAARTSTSSKPSWNAKIANAASSFLRLLQRHAAGMQRVPQGTG